MHPTRYLQLMYSHTHCLHLLHLLSSYSNIHSILRRISAGICVVCVSLGMRRPFRPCRPSRPPLYGPVELCLAPTGSCFWTRPRQAPITISRLITILQHRANQPATTTTLAGASSSLAALHALHLPGPIGSLPSPPID